MKHNQLLIEAIRKLGPAGENAADLLNAHRVELRALHEQTAELNARIERADIAVAAAQLELRTQRDLFERALRDKELIITRLQRQIAKLQSEPS